jgi:hypothetical protein
MLLAGARKVSGGRRAVALQGWEDGFPSLRAWRESRLSIAVTYGGRLWRPVDLRSLRRRNGPRQIDRNMPLASIADRGTWPLN